MNVQTCRAVVSYYDHDDGDLPFWLPEGCVMLGSKSVSDGDMDLKSDESTWEFSYTTMAEAVAHYGLKVKTHTEAGVLALLLRSDEAVKVACARLDSVYGVRNLITEFARFSYVVADEDKAEARKMALANVSYLTNLANQKTVQKAVDAKLRSETSANFEAKNSVNA